MKTTETIYGSDNGVKYRIQSIGWMGSVYIEILPVKDGIWFLYIEFGDRDPVLLTIGNSDAGESEYVSNLVFEDRNNNNIFVDISFAFPEDGMFIGDMINRDLYNATFYTCTAHDLLHEERYAPFNIHEIGK